MKTTIYTLTLCFEGHRPVCSCVGLQAVLDTLPQLAPDLYIVNRDDLIIGAAALYESGSWSLTLYDGREFSGQVGEAGPRVGPGYIVV